MRSSAQSPGFTLAELAVTLVICSIALTLILQGVQTAMSTASNTHNRKVARDLALETLGLVESGVFWEDMDERLYGTYDEEGYPEFSWEVVAGEDSLMELDDEGEPILEYDSWRRDPWEDDEDEEDEDAAQPFEKVRIRVTFPKVGAYPNHLTLERWIPWKQVYGSEDDEEAPDDEGENS